MLANLRRFLNRFKWYSRFNPMRDELKKRWAAYRQGCRIEYSKESARLIKGERTIITDKNSIECSQNGFINNFDHHYQQVRAENKTVDYSRVKKQYIASLNASLWVNGYPSGADGYLLNNPVKNGDVVIDVGAWCGITAYVLSKLVGDTGKVYAFEPDSKNYDLLTKNIELNGLTNVVAINKGIYTTTGKVKLTNANSSSRINSDENNDEKETIEVIRLDDFIKSIGKVDLVKMDIEGTELEVIESIKNYLKDNKIRFSIASYHYVNNEKTYIKLEKIFKEIGYDFVETDYPLDLVTWAH